MRDVTRNEATIVLAMDTSRSMQAADVRRLGLAKQAALAFLEEVPDDHSVGIVSLDLRRPRPAADGRPGSGTQRDRRAAPGLWDRDRGGDQPVGRPGLDREGDEPAVPSGDRSLAAVLLLSDGAQTAGDIRPTGGATGAAARRPGLHDRAGDRRGRGRGAATRRASERVVVAPDIPTLRQVAQATGGTFSEAPDAGRLEAVYRELEDAAPRPSASR